MKFCALIAYHQKVRAWSKAKLCLKINAMEEVQLIVKSHIITRLLWKPLDAFLCLRKSTIAAISREKREIYCN